MLPDFIVRKLVDSAESDDCSGGCEPTVDGHNVREPSYVQHDLLVDIVSVKQTIKVVTLFISNGLSHTSNYEVVNQKGIAIGLANRQESGGVLTVHNLDEHGLTQTTVYDVTVEDYEIVSVKLQDLIVTLLRDKEVQVVQVVSQKSFVEIISSN